MARSATTEAPQHDFTKLPSPDMRSKSTPLYQGTTRRLLLSPFSTSDIESFAMLSSHPKVQATDTCFDGPVTESTAKDIIEHYTNAWQDNNAYFFGIRYKHNQQLLGSISFMLNQAFQRAELGFWLGYDFWGQGIITEAAESMVKFGFYELTLHRIQAQHLSHNPASGRVMQKLGMKYEGCLRHYIKKSGHWYDMHQYGLLKEEHRQLGEEQLRSLALL